LHGWGSTQDRVTPLSLNVGGADNTFTVDFAFGQAVGISPGVVEIDQEQLYVTAVDPSSGLCTLANGFGRGYGSTTAAPHTAGSRVISRPKFPRIWLFNQLNEIIGAVFPDLFDVKRLLTVVTYPLNSYALPSADPVLMLDAQWQDPIGNWNRCPSYEIDPYDNSFRLHSGATPGRPLRILYGTEPQPFTDESDDFEATTGLPSSCSDVLTLGVVAKSVPGLDISRAQLSSVEQSDRSRVVPPNAGITAGKYLEGVYEKRLQNEAAALRKPFRARMVRVS